MIIHQTTNLEVSAYNLRFYEDIFWAPHFHRSFEFVLVPEDPEVKITTAALECGFQSVLNFNAVFKEKTGLTPGEYRRSRRH